MIRFTWLVFSFLCISGSVSAQTVLSSWQQARELARKQSPDLMVAQKQRQADRAVQQNGLAPLMPQVRWISTFDYNYALPTQLIPAEFLGGQPGEYKTVQFGTRYNLTSTLDASMPLLSGTAWWDARLAAAQKELSDMQLDQRDWELQQAITRAYFYALITRDAAILSQLNLQLADSLLIIASARQAQDLADPLEFNRIQANQIQAANNLAQNQLSAARNLAQLKLLLGIPQNQQLTLADSLSSYAVPTELKLNAVETPLLRLYRQQEQLARLSLQKDHLKRMPELSLYGKYSIQGQRNDIQFFASNAQWFEFGSVGLRLEVPIFGGLQRYNNVQRSKLKQDISRLEYQQQQEKQVKEDNDLLQTFNSNTLQLAKSKQAYELSLQNLQIGLLRYRQGLSSYETYLQLYQELLNTQQQYFRILSETAISRMLIDLKNQL